MVALTCSVKTRGTKTEELNKTVKGSWSSFDCKWDQNYGLISPKCSEYSSGLGVTPLNRFERAETMPSNNPQNMQNAMPNKYGPFLLL